MDLNSFAQTLNDSATSALLIGYNEYDGVRALLSYWQNDGLGGIHEVRAFQKALQDALNNTAYIFEMPSENTKIVLTYLLFVAS